MLLYRFKRGQILIPIVIVIAAIIGIIGVTIAGVAYTQSLATGQRASARIAEQAAHAGIDDALLRLVKDKNFNTSSEGASGSCAAGEYPLMVNNAITCVKIEVGGGGALTERLITSRAVVNGVERKFQTTVDISSYGEVRVISREELTN